MKVTEIGASEYSRSVATGTPLSTERDATDLIGEASTHHDDLIAVPVSRFLPDCFGLRTGMAASLLQKMPAYRYRFAMVGDFSEAMAASTSIREFVQESIRSASRCSSASEANWLSLSKPPFTGGRYTGRPYHDRGRRLLVVKLRPLLVVGAALLALFGTLWRQRQDASRPADAWEPVSFS